MNLGEELRHQTKIAMKEIENNVIAIFTTCISARKSNMFNRAANGYSTLIVSSENLNADEKILCNTLLHANKTRAVLDGIELSLSPSGTALKYCWQFSDAVELYNTTFILP